MSRPESEEQRRAREAATFTAGVSVHGTRVLAKLVVDGSGHLVQVPDSFVLKPGQRYATTADIDSKIAALDDEGPEAA